MLPLLCCAGFRASANRPSPAPSHPRARPWTPPAACCESGRRAGQRQSGGATRAAKPAGCRPAHAARCPSLLPHPPCPLHYTARPPPATCAFSARRPSSTTLLQHPPFPLPSHPPTHPPDPPATCTSARCPSSTETSSPPTCSSTTPGAARWACPCARRAWRGAGAGANAAARCAAAPSGFHLRGPAGIPHLPPHAARSLTSTCPASWRTRGAPARPPP